MLGEIRWLTWKSKAQKEKEDAEYAQWAFPYGDTQKEKISAILSDRFPEQYEKGRLVTFLTCKELVDGNFMRVYEHPATKGRAIEIIKKDVKRYKKLFHNYKNDAGFYIALAMADLSITEELNYPETAVLEKTAEEFAFTD